MGKIISRKKYEHYEYVTAVLISVGMAFFMLGSADDHKGNTIICFYITFLNNYIIIAFLYLKWWAKNYLFAQRMI